MVKYAGAGDSGDIWTATATSNLDMNNFSLINVNTIQILQTATTGQALEVYRNLAADDTDSPIVCFANQNAADDQSVLTVTTASMGLASAPMVLFETTDAAFNQLVLNIVQAGVGDGLLVSITAAGAGGTGIVIDQDADSYGVEIQSAATTNTQYGLQVVTGSGATAANIQYDGSEFARLGMTNDANGSNWFYRSKAAASTAGAVLKIENANAGDDQSVLTVTTASNGAASNPMVLFESTDAAFDQPLLSLVSDGTGYGILAVTNQNAGAVVPLVYLHATDAAYDQEILHLVQDGTGRGLFIEITAATGGKALEIDQDADAYGVEIQSAATTNTQYGLQVVTGAGATAANIQYSGSEFARLGLHNDANGSNWFYRNLAAADIAGAVLKIENANAGDDQSVLTVTTASNGAASKPMVLFESTDAAFDQLVLNIIQDGAYSAVQIIQNGITPASNNAGALYINNTANERSALSIYSDMDGSAGRALVQIRADNVAFDQPIVQINNDGTGVAILFNQTQDVEVVDFDGCTDGGITNTVLATSVKCQMPNGATGYLNLYTAAE